MRLMHVRQLRGLLAVRSWPVWSLPRPALAVVLVVDVAAGTALLTSSVFDGYGNARDLAVFVAFCASALFCLEIARRLDEPTGAHLDLMTVWTLPIALLLPSPFALLAAVPDNAWSQWRGRPSLLYRRIFTVAAIGLAHFAGGQAFRAMAGVHPPGDEWGNHAAALLAAAMIAGCCCAAINAVLIAAAIQLSNPTTSWRALLGDREMLTIYGVEVSTGVTMTALVAQSPVLILPALPAIILLHRSLLHRQLTAAARTDAKTGLLNAAAWQRELERELDRAMRKRTPIAVMLMDLDRFKSVNDTHGHLVGDEVLVSIADVLRAELRNHDLIGRFGGEEFVATFDADLEQATEIAERIRRCIATHPFVTDRMADGVGVAVTASIGVTVLEADRRAGADELLAAADASLYAAKTAGRNRVHIAPLAGPIRTASEPGRFRRAAASVGSAARSEHQRLSPAPERPAIVEQD